MQFESLNAFIEMGGHGLYVWLCYGCTAVVIAYNLCSPRLMQREVKKTLLRRLRRNEVDQ